MLKELQKRENLGARLCKAKPFWHRRRKESAKQSPQDRTVQHKKDMEKHEIKKSWHTLAKRREL